jgi:hypothetical protein
MKKRCVAVAFTGVAGHVRVPKKVGAVHLRSVKRLARIPVTRKVSDAKTDKILIFTVSQVYSFSPRTFTTYPTNDSIVSRVCV